MEKTDLSCQVVGGLTTICNMMVTAMVMDKVLQRKLQEFNTLEFYIKTSLGFFFSPRRERKKKKNLRQERSRCSLWWQKSHLLIFGTCTIKKALFRCDVSTYQSMYARTGCL